MPFDTDFEFNSLTPFQLSVSSGAAQKTAGEKKKGSPLAVRGAIPVYRFAPQLTRNERNRLQFGHENTQR